MLEETLICLALTATAHKTKPKTFHGLYGLSPLCIFVYNAFKTKAAKPLKARL